MSITKTKLNNYIDKLNDIIDPKIDHIIECIELDGKGLEAGYRSIEFTPDLQNKSIIIDVKMVFKVKGE